MEQARYVFGPVASRRLGRSLGIDIVPAKSCTLDCIFCEVGRTTLKTIERRPYVAPGPILEQLQTYLACIPEPDYLTITGSGEPTLNSLLGQIIEAIRSLLTTPIALLTNGTLFFRPDVRHDAAKADVVLPTLDAPDQATFETIHRPHPSITIHQVIQGLQQFRKEYKGQIWLEVFLVDGINTANQQVVQLKSIIELISPDRIHLNTAVRPTADPDVPVPDMATIKRIAQVLGPKCQLIFEPEDLSRLISAKAEPQVILALLKRRPSTIGQLADGLGLAPCQVESIVRQLLDKGLVLVEDKAGRPFYRAT